MTINKDITQITRVTFFMEDSVGATRSAVREPDETTHHTLCEQIHSITLKSIFLTRTIRSWLYFGFCPAFSSVTVKSTSS